MASRVCAISLLLLIAVVETAHAKPASDWTARKREKKEAEARQVEFEDENPRSYALPLGFGYAVPPVLFGSSLLIWATNGTTDTAVPLLYVGLASMFVVPPSVHIIYGNGPGAARALFGSLGSTVSLGFVGGTITQATADCSSSDEESFCEGLSFLGGALIGAAVGYVSWAIVDTAFLAHTPGETTPSRTSHLQLTPTFGPIINRTEASHTPKFHGLSFGVTGTF